MNYNFITVVSVYGHNDGSSSIPSILKSSESLPGSRALLLSITRPASLPESIFWKKIPTLNRQQYSLFMLYFLASFIETDFALCVQADGWVLSKEAWSDDFLEYDYIGAPNEVGLIKPKSESDPGFRFESMLLRGNWEWMAEEDPINLLNGGFSLRSKKLLTTPRNIGIPYTFDDHPIRQNEDVQLCLFMRSQLIDAGIKFPPISIAKKFAFEYFPPTKDPINFYSIFGIHCGHMRLTAPNQIIIENEFHPISRKFLIPVLEGMGYELHFI